ncbi:response regulator [Sediminibacterium roseum]|uniref:Response regulator n=1 Tax=Sediminibacterium roseum TaxID=1978412 RepID=A0ABW9ZV75_9BACT|nr:response regulator [Sediminibacterium roseum]NCI50134.1 response regulator [Sediminibacterium roseum]
MRTVLVVDDEIDFFLLIKDYLGQRDYQVFSANTLAEGWKMLEEKKFDVLLLDNNLPDGFGWKQAPEIQKRFPDLRITLISAYESIFLVTTLEGVPFRIMEKPVSLETLISYF